MYKHFFKDHHSFLWQCHEPQETGRVLWSYNGLATFMYAHAVSEMPSDAVFICRPSCFLVTQNQRLCVLNKLGVLNWTRQKEHLTLSLWQFIWKWIDCCAYSMLCWMVGMALRRVKKRYHFRKEYFLGQLANSNYTFSDHVRRLLSTTEKELPFSQCSKKSQSVHGVKICSS